MILGERLEGTVLFVRIDKQASVGLGAGPATEVVFIDRNV